MTAEVDVAILGSGLAGSLLARQLRIAHPRLRILCLERSAQTSFKVGESSVELFSNYLTRRLGLSTYMYEAHLPKNGLRFFFDRETKDAPLEAMSEIGSDGMPFHPSFQIDRARLERDLREMNLAAGVDLREGAKVLDVALGTAGESHSVRWTAGGESFATTARWVIDATGRASVLAKRLDLRVRTDDHGCAASWARYRGVLDLDGLAVDGPWRARVRNTSRRLSTVHFCYRGYWIWLIPLRGGVTSVGVVGDRRHFDRAWLTREGFVQFLQSHAAVARTLENAEMIDFGAYGQLSYATRRFFGADRWALIGEAAAFTDPFYSPGSDFIALENDLVTDLIGRDLEGESIDERVAAYDAYVQFRFAANLALYRDQYELLGSYDLLLTKWRFDIASYYNLWVSSYMLDRHLDLAHVRDECRHASFVVRSLERFAELFGAAERRLTRDGEYGRNNLGRFEEPLRGLDFVAEVGTVRPKTAIDARSLAVFRQAREEARQLLGQEPDAHEWSYADFVTGRAFAAAMQS